MLEEKDTISSIIVELQEILAEHGDLPVVGRYGESAILCTEKYSVTPNFPSSQYNLLDFLELEETLFDFKENSELEPCDILNKVINFLETEFDKESKNVIHIYMKYTAHDNLPYTESKLVVRRLKDSDVGKFLYYGFLGIIINEFKKYLELVVDTEE